MRNHKTSWTHACVLLIVLALPRSAVAWDPVRDLTGRTLKQHVERKLEKADAAIGKILHNPIEYALNLPMSVFADLCSAPVQYYGGTLAGQAAGKWKALPPELIAAVQHGYNNNLNAVRYAEGIRTTSGAQAFGNLIYFNRSINFTDPNDMHWMLHELEHTSQYASSGGQAIKLCEYMGKAVGNGFRHDSIDWERAADRKADWLLGSALQGLYRASIGPNSILIANDTNIAITFSLQTANSDWTEFTLPPHTQDIFDSNSSADTWMNVRVITPGRHESNYSYDGGSSVRMFWTNTAVLEHSAF